MLITLYFTHTHTHARAHGKINKYIKHFTSSQVGDLVLISLPLTRVSESCPEVSHTSDMRCATE